MLRAIASFLTGAAASMGLGGGFILVLYLTLYADIPQRTAQGVNLFFFLTVSLLSLYLHYRHKLLEIKILLPAIAAGIPAVWIGCMVSEKLGSSRLRPLFAVFVLAVGCRELFSKRIQKNPPEREPSRGSGNH